MNSPSQHNLSMSQSDLIKHENSGIEIPGIINPAPGNISGFLAHYNKEEKTESVYVADSGEI